MTTPHFDPDNLGDAEATLGDYLAIAADIVQDLAPPPDPLPDPDTYSPRAARAERLLTNYLKSTSGGTITRETVEDISSGFSGLDAVQNIVKMALGPYYVGGEDPDVGKDDGVAFVGRSPF